VASIFSHLQEKDVTFFARYCLVGLKLVIQDFCKNLSKKGGDDDTQVFLRYKSWKR